MAILGRCRFAAAIEQARIAGRPLRRFESQSTQMFGECERDHGLQHRHFHILTLPAAFAMEQRSEHGVDQRHAGGLVGDQAGHVIGCVATKTVQADQAAGGLNDVVESRLVGVGPVLAVAGRHAVDDVGLDGGHRRITEAQSFDGGHAHVVHQHVGVRQQSLQYRHTVGRFQIDGE